MLCGLEMVTLYVVFGKEGRRPVASFVARPGGALRPPTDSRCSVALFQPSSRTLPGQRDMAPLLPRATHTRSGPLLPATPRSSCLHCPFPQTCDFASCSRLPGRASIMAIPLPRLGRRTRFQQPASPRCAHNGLPTAPCCLLFPPAVFACFVCVPLRPATWQRAPRCPRSAHASHRPGTPRPASLAPSSLRCGVRRGP